MNLAPQPGEHDARGARRDSRRRPWLGMGLLAAALGGIAVLALLFARPREAAQDLWDEAHAALQAGQFDRAETALKRLSDRRPPTVEDVILRAQLDLAGKRDDAAIAALASVPDREPLAAQARLLAGKVELRRGRPRYAEALFLKTLALDPSVISARRELVYIYGMQTRRQAIREQMRILAESSPLTFDHMFVWCLTRGSVWDSNEIVDFMTAFLANDPKDDWSRLALADSLENLGNLDEVERVLQPLPLDNPDARAARARLAIDRGDVTLAEELLAAGPENHPKLALLRGKLALMKRDPKAAIRHFRAADAADPNSREAVQGLSQALRLAGDEAEAKHYFDLARKHEEVVALMAHAATDQGKADPELPLKLGAAHEAIGRYDEARGWYQLAINRNPIDSAAQAALSRLRARMDGSNSSAKTP